MADLLLGLGEVAPAMTVFDDEAIVLADRGEVIVAPWSPLWLSEKNVELARVEFGPGVCAPDNV